MLNNANLPVIPAKRYFSREEACALAGILPEQLLEWQRQEGGLIGKGNQIFTRQDIIKLRQLAHGIGDYFAREALDAQGNPVITATQMRQELNTLLNKFERALAK